MNFISLQESDDGVPSRQKGEFSTPASLCFPSKLQKLLEAFVLCVEKTLLQKELHGNIFMLQEEEPPISQILCVLADLLKTGLGKFQVKT